MDRRTRTCVFGLLVIAALGIWQVFTGDTFVRQERRMHLAEKHLPVVLETLARNAEFKKLRANVYTGTGGSLVISGNLVDEKELQKLKQMVEKTKPPVIVVYHIAVERF